MSDQQGYFRQFSWPIVVSAMILMAIGILSIHAVENADEALAGSGLAFKQTVFALIGIACFFALTSINYQKLGPISYALYAVMLVLLVVVLKMPQTKGSKHWIPLPGIQFQPSELAKLTFILAMAWYLRYRNSYRRLSGLIALFCHDARARRFDPAGAGPGHLAVVVAYAAGDAADCGGSLAPPAGDSVRGAGRGLSARAAQG